MAAKHSSGEVFSDASESELADNEVASDTVESEPADAEASSAVSGSEPTDVDDSSDASESEPTDVEDSSEASESETSDVEDSSDASEPETADLEDSSDTSESEAADGEVSSDSLDSEVVDEKASSDASESEPAEGQTSPDASESGPTFTGKWKFASFTENHKGAFYNIIKAMSGWFKANAAQVVGFGAGKTELEIKQDGDNFELKTTTVLGKTEYTYIVGKGEQQITDPTGGQLLISPVWDGKELHVTSKFLNGKEGPVLHRSLKGEKNMVYTMSHDGHDVEQIWDRLE